MDDFLSLVDALSAPLRERGYRKRKYSWSKRMDGTTVVFAIQRSAFGPDVWYYNFGVGINAFYETDITSISRCGVVYRIDQTVGGKTVNSGHLIDILDHWEREYGRDLQTLRIRALENRLPRQASWETMRFLTTADLSRYTSR